MYASKLSDDNLYDSYIDPAVYEHSHNTAFPSLEADSSSPSSYALPHYAPHIPHTTAHDALHTYSTGLNRFGNETSPVYLLDQIGFETELHTTFGNSHVEERAAEDDMLGRYQAFVSEDMDRDVYPFSRAEISGDTWFDREIYANSVDQFEDSTTLCNSPSTTSTSEVDSMYTERASMRGRHTHGFGMRSRRSGRSHTSSPSSGMSDFRALSAPSSASEHNYGGLHLCHMCNRSFTLSKDLKRHMSSIHDQERWPCPEPGCRQGFSRRDKLLQHRRKHHEAHIIKEESGTCSRPSSVFGGSLGSDIGSIVTEDVGGYDWSLLDDDHDPSTPQNHPISSKKCLDCPFCDKKFTLQHDRLRHLRTLHRKQENFVYRCAVPGCAKRDKMFNRLDNFKKHLKNKHGDESPKEMVLKSRTLGGDTFTVMTPEMYSYSQ